METELSRTILSEEENSKVPMLIMTVDIGDGYKDNLTIYENSSIKEVLQAFSSKHNLTKDQEKILYSQLSQHFPLENYDPEISRNEYFQQ